VAKVNVICPAPNKLNFNEDVPASTKFRLWGFRFSRRRVWKWEPYVRGAYCIRHQGDDGGSTHFWNVGLIQRDYTAVYPRRLSSSQIRFYHGVESLLVVINSVTLKLYF
jgi:hypothetical protein